MRTINLFVFCYTQISCFDNKICTAFSDVGNCFLCPARSAHCILPTQSRSLSRNLGLWKNHCLSIVSFKRFCNTLILLSLTPLFHLIT